MRSNFKSLDKFRTSVAPYVSNTGDRFGAFQVPHEGKLLNIICTDGDMGDGSELDGWEHVSVHAYDPVFRKQYTPTWAQMCFVKSLFWEDDEVAIEYHVAKKDWISIHDHVLHLWRHAKHKFPTPPKILV